MKIILTNQFSGKAVIALLRRVIFAFPVVFAVSGCSTAHIQNPDHTYWPMSKSFGNRFEEDKPKGFDIPPAHYLEAFLVGGTLGIYPFGLDFISSPIHYVGDVVGEWRLKRKNLAPAEKPRQPADKESPKLAASGPPSIALNSDRPKEVAGRTVSDVDKPTYSFSEKPNHFALVVGIEKYPDLPDAHFSERDAQSVVEHLIAMGYPSRNVVFLSGEKASHKGIEKYLEDWLPRSVDEDSEVFFYFSGHGAPDIKSGQAFLVPWDGDANYLHTTGYPLKRLYEQLAALKARHVLVAMDSCFSGAGGRSVLAAGTRPLIGKVESVLIPPKITVFAATSSDQVTSVINEQGHGSFTYYFLKGLSGAAKNASGTVTTQALYRYLKPKVEDTARRQNREQDPVLAGTDWEILRFQDQQHK